MRVDAAEHDPRQWPENALGSAPLALACAERNLKFVTFSSDLVFDGRCAPRRPYVESDRPAPLNSYGRAKLHAEEAALAVNPRSLVIRTAAFFGPWDMHNFAHQVLFALRQGRRFASACDQVVSPTYVPHRVDHALDLMIDDERGLWHLGNQGEVSWAGFARQLARSAGLPVHLVDGVPGASLSRCAPRPADAALASERGWIMPPLDAAIERYLRAVGTGAEHGDVPMDHGLHAPAPELAAAAR